MDNVKKFLTLTIGVVLLTCGVYFFKIPNGFSTGGVTGMSTLLGKVTPVTPANWIVIINILVLIVGFLILGKDTGVLTVYCSLLFSGLTQVFEFLFPLSQPLTNQPFLELIYAILLTSAGSALMFHCGASSGGTDIIALILKKHTSLDIGKALLCVDSLIAFSSIFLFGIEIGLFSILGLFMKAFLVDTVIENMNSCKYFLIITSHAEDISQYIITQMHHGATLVSATGAYTKDNKTVLHTVCKRIEGIKLQKKIRELDPSAFVIITTSSEIIGRGFRGV